MGALSSDSCLTLVVHLAEGLYGVAEVVQNLPKSNKTFLREIVLLRLGWRGHLAYCRTLSTNELAG